MICAECKNLDVKGKKKKKIDGAAGGSRYYCTKLKTYVGGDMHACDKFAKADRDSETYDKLCREGKEWDNDAHSPSFYFIILLILLLLIGIVFIFDRDSLGFGI